MLILFNTFYLTRSFNTIYSIQFNILFKKCPFSAFYEEASVASSIMNSNECLAVFLRLVSGGFVIIADITIRIFTGGSLDSSSSIISSNVSLVWNPFRGVVLGFSSDDTLWTMWIFLVWVFSFSNLSVVKEHFLQMNFSAPISFDFQTNNESVRVQVAYFWILRRVSARIHDQMFSINFSSFFS